MDKSLLDILVCPTCKGDVNYQSSQQELICVHCRIAYPLRDDIAVMLPSEARALNADEGIV